MSDKATVQLLPCTDPLEQIDALRETVAGVIESARISSVCVVSVVTFVDADGVPGFELFSGGPISVERATAVLFNAATALASMANRERSRAFNDDADA